MQRWLQFSVVIGSIATLLLNFIQPNDVRGLISAAVFTVASLLSIAYSCGIFVYRAYKLRARDAEGLYYGVYFALPLTIVSSNPGHWTNYQDKFGPTALVFVLFAALATNLGLRWQE